MHLRKVVNDSKMFTKSNYSWENLLCLCLIIFTFLLLFITILILMVYFSQFSFDLGVSDLTLVDIGDDEFNSLTSSSKDGRYDEDLQETC